MFGLHSDKECPLQVTDDEVQKIASLARVRLAPEESERMAVELSRILEYMALLDEVDTSELPPLQQPELKRGQLRRDVVRHGLAQEEALAAAPRVRLGFFSVPKVLR
jgi:aspartyl-tRNA(Asn)/glutamyl-tRNA(Gln) amidotransferase subunit C